MACTFKVQGKYIIADGLCNCACTSWLLLLSVNLSLVGRKKQTLFKGAGINITSAYSSLQIHAFSPHDTHMIHT